MRGLGLIPLFFLGPGCAIAPNAEQPGPPAEPERRPAEPSDPDTETHE